MFAEVANSSEFLKTLESCTEPSWTNCRGSWVVGSKSCVVGRGSWVKSWVEKIPVTKNSLATVNINTFPKTISKNNELKNKQTKTKLNHGIYTQTRDEGVTA